MDTSSILQQLGSVIGDWQHLGVLAALITLVNLLVNATKLGKMPTWIKAGWRPYIALVLGAIGGVLTALQQGQPVLQALVTGLVVGLGAIGAHETITNASASQQARATLAAQLAEMLQAPSGAQAAVAVADLKEHLDSIIDMHPDNRLKALVSKLDASKLAS